MADSAVPVWGNNTMKEEMAPPIEETTPVDEVAPPIEETTSVPDPRYAPTRKSWELMRESFRGEEPLAFIEDPQTRDFLRVLTDRSDNPEEERKKWALAAYFAQNVHADIRACHGNLDLFLKKFYNNEPVSIDYAYRDIGAALGVQQRDRAWFENSTAGAAISGTAKTLNTFFIEPPAFLSKLWVAANTAQMKAELSAFQPEAAKLIRDPKEAGKMAESGIRNLYTEYYAPVEEAAWRDANVPDDWMTNSDSLGDWCRNAALSLVNYLPQLAMQTGLMAATGGVSALGTVYGISGYYDIKDDHPEMSESDAVVYGVGVGLINGVLEKVTLGIIDGKVSKKVAEAGIKKGILQAARHFGWNASKEGAEEGLEEFAQNLLDIAMGLRGDTGEWKTSDWWREMRRGVPESAFLGFATGGPLAFDSYRNLRKVALRRETIRSTISDRVEELSAKDSLSEREEQELKELQVVMDAGNPADMEKAVRDVYEREVIRNQEEVNRREHEADRREEQEEMELTDDEILLRNAQRAERNQRLRRNLPHNPQETVETATELLRDFPEISLDIVYSIDELPEPVRAKIDAEGLDSNRIRAWVDEDSDIVHLIADRVRPSEVGRVIGHEVIGHKGLRAVFGERFDSLLDLVYRDHFEEVAKLGDRYHRDTETLENRRYLTEEFLAECADAKVKPSWWKEFLGFVRQQLRRILPKMRFTDADIEAALSRSARAMRRRNRAGNNTESGTRNWLRFSSALTDDPEGGKAFPKRKASTYAEARNQLRSLQGKTFVNADSGIEAVLSSTGINKLLSNKAREKSFANGFTNAEHFEAISNIDRLYENAVLVETHEDRKGSEHIRSIKRFAAPFYTGKTFAEAYITVKESIQAGHRIYSLELDELKKPSTVKKGVRPGLLTRPADGTPPDTVADTTKQYPVAGSYNKLLDKTEKSRALLEKEEKKSKFSIIGEEGAAAAAEWYGRQDAEMWKMLGLDLSTQQGNAVRRLEDLSVAKRMAEAGKEAETIKLATGWEKGADGKWRTETDDNWQFSPEFLRLEPYESLPIDRCIQEGTELFSAYPELREFNVRLSSSVEMQQSKGWFDREGEEIVLQQDGLPAMKKTLIHEIQHYIQEQEGFAPGGNLNTASRLAATGNYSSTELADAYRKFHDNVKLLPGDLYENIGRVLHEDSFRNFRNVLGEELGELWGSGETAIDFMRNAYDSSNRETFLQIYEAELEKAEKGHPDAFSLYRRLAGEVEARNAEKRSGLSLEERLRTLLANTEDVAEQDKIYLEKNTADLPLSVPAAIPSKAGFRVERVNENAGRELNAAKGVVVQPEMIYKHGEVPEQQPQKWLREKCMEYAKSHNVIGEHSAPALGDGVKVSVGSVKAVLNHPGSDIKNNLIAVIPDMLENSVLVQTERFNAKNSPNKTHLLAAKVRYGEEYFLVGMVIHENQGKYYYDHELSEMNNADQNGRPGTTGAQVESASVLTIIQNVLFSSGFDKSSEQNIRFSVAPVWTGSAASYDAPSLQYIGTGEGAQVYGWGLYGSSSRNVGEWYARQDVKRKNRERILLDGKEPDLESMDKLERNVLLDVLGRKGSISGTLEYYRLDLKKPRNPHFYDDSAEIRSQMQWLEENQSRIQYIPENENVSGRRNLYRQTFWPGKEENLLDWDKPVPENQRRKIEEQLKTAGLFVDGDPDKASEEYRALKTRKNDGEPVSEEELSAAYEKAAHLHAQRNVIGTTINGDIPSGSMVYENLEDILGGPKAVSEFLYRAGIDGVTFVGGSSGVRNYVAFSDNDIRVDEHIRFGLGEYSEADQRDIVAILQPYVGMNTEREPVDYRKYLAEHGVEISDQDAWEFALEAVRQNIAFARKRNEERRNQWFYENYPLYKECVDFCGSADFKIKPSLRFSGEAFSGSWISPEFVKYSEKRKRGPKESESSYRRYQERREAALARAEGTASDEIAESIARRTGRDTLEVEQELIDFFRDLKKRDFHHEYTKFREEQILGDKQAARKAFDEWIKEEETRIQNEVVELLEKGTPITAEWIAENRKVFDELYRQLFDGETPPGKVGKADLEAINAALMQQGANASTFAQAYKVAREKAYGEFMEKLRAFRDKVMAANADAISLQRDAVSFAEQNLPAESRGEFTRGILKLMEYSTAPTGKYPEGRRMREFRSLVERMVNRAGELRKTTAQNEIREMLDAVKVKRNYKGIATAVIPSEQERVERIRRVIDMNIATLAKAVDANNEQIMKLEESGEDSTLLKKYQEDNQLLEMFGDLEHRSANDVEEAAEKLKNIIFGGKMAFFDLLSKRRDRINDMRSRALDDITFGKLETFVRVDPEYFTKYWLKNQSLGTLMRLASGKSIQDFDNSVFGELYREVEDSTQAEQTALRRMQRDFDEALRTICGVDGNYVARMKKKGKFFRMISEVNENSGVFKTEFSRGVDLESKKYPNKLLEHGRRAVLKKLIPVEDSEFHGETREGARSLLRRIDNGEAITEWDGFLLDDITIDFLRQQLADFDAGLEQSYEIFNEKQDDENFNRLLADARKEAQVMLLGHSSQESRRRVEVPLSQGAALQLLLTWEQEDFRPNMKWNGWSEESMRQIKAFLKPEVLRMGYWMRDYIARNQKQLDAAVSKRYGAHLPGIENYFPGVFKGQNSRAVESEFGRGYGTMSINPNFLISRKFHLKPADIDADAFTTFFGNQINQAHFLAWSDTIRDLNAVYGSMRVKNAITNNFGRGVEENIRERIAVLAQGGDPRGDGYIARLFGKMFRNWIPAKIIANQGSIIKQMLGTVSYMNQVPVMEFVKYSAKANFSNPEFREFVRWAKNTDYMKNRLAGGLNRDLAYLLNYTRDSRAYSPLSEGLIDLGTWGTRWADAWSTLHGGYAVYMYALEQARKNGKTEAEAREAARRAWMRATDETQQSGYLKDQNYFQANQGGYRYLTAFMSNPIQTMNLQIQTFHELRYGRDKKASLQKLCRQILINHLIVPSLMIATTDLIRHGFDFGEWWDELEWEDYLVGWLLGSFESLFLFGKVLGNVGNYAMDRIVGRKRPFYQSIVAFPMVEDISYDIGFLSKLIDSDKPVTEKEVFSSIRALGDFLMAGGIADRFAPLGPVGAILHAVGTQGKRIAGWFEEK